MRSLSVKIENLDEVVIAALQAAIHNCASSSFRANSHPEDKISAVRDCDAMNAVIEYFGGAPVDYSSHLAGSNK
jgi:hypothetical protein